MRNLLKSLGNFVLDILETIAIALAIFVLSYIFAVQPHKVQGDSMLPSFMNNNFLLTDKITYRFREPARGDVVVFKFPKDPRFDYIKRIIALPEEKIQIKDNQIIIYNKQHPEGFILQEEYLPLGTATKGKKALPVGKIVDVPHDHYLVLGDNRSSSSDSREWGAVPKENIVGRAFFVYWPPQNFSFVAHANYDGN